MSETADDKRGRLVGRTLEDLGDDAYRQDGELKRSEIDATYLRRGITPDEAIAIERALAADGIRIVEDTAVTEATFEGIPSPRGGTALEQLLGLARKYPLLNEVEERELGYAIQDGLRLPDADQFSPVGQRVLARAEHAKAKLVTSNIRLVAKMAYDRRFRYRMDPEDLVQYGLMGLMRACDKFDPDWGTRFSTYAVWWIRQAISRGIDDVGSTIRLPVHMRGQISKYRRTRRSFGLSTGYSAADIPRIAESLGWDEAFTARIAQLSEQKVISYDVPIDDESSTPLREFINDEAPTPEEVAIASDLAEVLGELVDGIGNERLIDIVRRRFGIDGPAETLEQIGQQYGVTRERIRQLESKALRILRGRARKIGLHKTFEGD